MPLRSSYLPTQTIPMRTMTNVTDHESGVQNPCPRMERYVSCRICRNGIMTEAPLISSDKLSSSMCNALADLAAENLEVAAKTRVQIHPCKSTLRHIHAIFSAESTQDSNHTVPGVSGRSQRR
ncbi:hypothetical protein G6011_01771 [Alternaria panax]|uniref:Uncharacterized protein n=1 Tax=Alternaria panax TaxID=48097 RepID=A0AAD4IL47_9PLEO|nr:hypothetical protein G6011_01771 [Alternaria panax]